jgi:hypothetical protein
MFSEYGLSTAVYTQYSDGDVPWIEMDFIVQMVQLRIPYLKYTIYKSKLVWFIVFERLML